jgi:hypothetical protein
VDSLVLNQHSGSRARAGVSGGLRPEAVVHSMLKLNRGGVGGYGNSALELCDAG